jgi:large conductance mechanosensitive channel
LAFRLRRDLLFLVVKGINRMKREAEAEVEATPAPELPADVKLLAEIRDILKTRTAAG